jgi:dTDP-4-amino-4,6-dideoxygalactose transaminase
MIGNDEKAAVAAVLDGPILVHGPRADDFEASFAAFTGAPHAVSVSSCTAGMHLVWFALGLQAGDEVIVPAQTHAATAHAVALTGATPVFVDVDRRTGNVTAEQIAEAITPRTKGIAVVHFLGCPVDMPPIVALAQNKGLFLLEDCALAPGTRIDGVHAGLLGDVGVFSFYPVKHMTTAEGGMIVTRNENLARKLRLVRAFGVDRSHNERKVPGVYDVVALGFNYRMSEIHAALGTVQTARLPEFLEARARNFAALANALSKVAGISLLETGSVAGRVSSHYCLSVLLDSDLAPKRPDIMQAMTAQGVGTSVYYPHPVPRLSYYRQQFGRDPEAFPNATRISDASIALPVGPHLTEGDMMIIAQALNKSIEEIR